MTEIPNKKQTVTRRAPRQQRALEKVGLILEAALRVLERGGIEALNTNKLAEVAGVSIGTLYQYFPDKRAVLDALAQRELAGLEQGVLDALKGDAPDVPGGRVRVLMSAVLKTYGGRTGVHRQLIDHLLSRRGRNPFPALRNAVIALLSTEGVLDNDGQKRKFGEAEAFVLSHSISGVLRGLLASTEKVPPERRQAIEDAMVKVVVALVPTATPARPPAASAS